MDRDLGVMFLQYLERQAAAPFGDTAAVSSRTLQPFSLAGQEAAKNLLTKAGRALRDGDADRARVLVDRAVRLPYDEHERALPVTREAHFELFCLVTDALEASDAGDSRWIDAAVEVLTSADEDGRCELRDVLLEIDNDYLLDRSERASLRSAIAGLPDRPPLRDQIVATQQLRERILSVVDACRIYQAALRSTTC